MLRQDIIKELIESNRKMHDLLHNLESEEEMKAFIFELQKTLELVPIKFDEGPLGSFA